MSGLGSLLACAHVSRDGANNEKVVLTFGSRSLADKAASALHEEGNEWAYRKPLDREEIEDFLADAITDSLDMDWDTRDGAKSILRAVEKQGLNLRITEMKERA